MTEGEGEKGRLCGGGAEGERATELEDTKNQLLSLTALPGASPGCITS